MYFDVQKRIFKMYFNFNVQNVLLKCLIPYSPRLRSNHDMSLYANRMILFLYFISHDSASIEGPHVVNKQELSSGKNRKVSNTH